MMEPNDDQGTIVCWEDHIVPILENPDIHTRDKALFAVAWESRARYTEFHRLTFGDVEDRGDHVVIWISCQDGRKRLVSPYKSMPYLKRWVQAEHPVTESLASNADPLEEAPLRTPIWTYINSNESVHQTLLSHITKRVCERSDVPTVFTLHDIRRSQAKLLAAQTGLGEPPFENYSAGRHKWQMNFMKESKTRASKKTLDHDPRLGVKIVEHGLHKSDLASGVDTVTDQPFSVAS